MAPKRNSKKTSTVSKVQEVVESKPSERSIEEIEHDLQLGSSSGEESSGEEEETDNQLEGFEDDESESESDSEEKIIGTAQVTEPKKQTEPLTHSVKKTITKETTTAANTKSAKDRKGVIYIGRIPHGFYEAELRKYFEQFGTIRRLRLSRNKKTGKSKHYGFIEFEETEVAKIAAETMNNYLLFGHLLKVSLLEKEQIHEDLFNNANSKFKVVPWGKISKKKNDSPKTVAKWEQLNKKLNDKKAAKQEELKKKGIDFDLSLLK